MVGIGAEIKFDPESGYTDVLGLAAGSAAERAGVLAGDKMVTIDGKLCKGLDPGRCDRARSAARPASLSLLSVAAGRQARRDLRGARAHHAGPVQHFMASRKVG